MNDHYYLLNDLTLQWQIDFRGANPNENLNFDLKSIVSLGLAISDLRI